MSSHRHFFLKMRLILSSSVLLVIALHCYSQTIGSKYITGKPKFINPSLGTVMIFDSPLMTTGNDDSVRMNSISGLVDLSSLVNKAISDSSDQYKDFRLMDATKIGIIGNYKGEEMLFYCNVSDAGDLYNNKISNAEFVQRIQILPISDYILINPVKEGVTFMGLLKMDHAYYSFPMRLSILMPFGEAGGFSNNLGIELSNVWARPKSVVNFKFQVSFIWMMHKEKDWYERYIIPSYNMGIGFNFLGDIRFNLKPYITVGWNPAYYYFESDDKTVTSPKNLTNTWYLLTGSLNYGIDLEAWARRGLAFSIAIEQSKYLAEILPDLYGSVKAISLDYFTFKIGLIF